MKSNINLREKESRILDVAQKRFAAYGLNKVTMDEIAADLGMGKTSLYYYFSTKEELLRRVIQREQNTFLDRICETLESSATASEKLRQYTAERTAYSRQLINLQIMTTQNWLYTRAAFRSLFDDFAKREQECLTRILKDGKKSGEFQMKSAYEIAQLFLHTLQGLRFRMRAMVNPSAHRIEESELAELERDISSVTELFVRSIRVIR